MNGVRSCLPANDSLIPRRTAAPASPVIPLADRTMLRLGWVRTPSVTAQADSTITNGALRELLASALPQEPTLTFEDLLEELSDWLLRFIKGGAPDESTAPAVGLLVGLLRTGRRTAATEDATVALYTLVSRGAHGDAIREAGGVPVLLAVLRDGEDEGVERASGALTHLAMQGAANREAIFAAGGVPILVRRLQSHDQAMRCLPNIMPSRTPNDLP